MSAVGSRSSLPSAVQSDRPVGFALVAVVAGLLAVGGATVALEGVTTAELSVAVLGVAATGITAMALAAGSAAKTAQYERDELYRVIGELRDRTARLDRGDVGVGFDVYADVDGVDELEALGDHLASIRGRLAENRRTDRSLSELERTVSEHAEVTRAVADGDLTRRFEPQGSHERIDELARNSNELLAEIEGAFSTLQTFSGDVVTYSRELNVSVETVRREGERTSEMLSSVVDDTDAQNEQLRTVTAEMESLSTTIEEIAATATEVADVADRTARVGDEGSRSAAAAIEGMDVIDEETERTLAEIEALEDDAERIDELVDSISEIAEQTNLLALNANIEASRSVDGGRGFGAVADEIKALSEEVYDSVQDVEERLEALRERALSAGTEVRTSRERIESSVTDVSDAARALDEIAELAERTNEGVQEISAATQQQASSTQEVVAMIEDAGERSEETAATAGTAVRRASAQADALAHVAESATVLTEQAAELNRRLEEYATDRGYDLPEARTAGGVDPESVSTAGPVPESIGDGSRDPPSAR
ncbi:methyl-accepting chemotaxis protein [Natrarchaeobius oligotrophus]|uniref:Chemotaxis protein n=1 Tax=Natrarchaeobius chitinivorans TaxID=1679083 RepID=A0A3N6NQ34_NATCH|nr:methyl-accepting chemotaxis protein [Natrarchaeobius chitinivorans]RQH01893.1 chemotaxis protein [Natrarchaeobius chitinivorans]